MPPDDEITKLRLDAAEKAAQHLRLDAAEARAYRADRAELISTIMHYDRTGLIESELVQHGDDFLRGLAISAIRGERDYLDSEQRARRDAGMRAFQEHRAAFAAAIREHGLASGQTAADAEIRAKEAARAASESAWHTPQKPDRN